MVKTGVKNGLVSDISMRHILMPLIQPAARRDPFVKVSELKERYIRGQSSDRYQLKC
jgi:hypothetical protein